MILQNCQFGILMAAQLVKLKAPTLMSTYTLLHYTRIHFAQAITNWFFVRLTSTTRNQRKPTIGRAVMKPWKGKKCNDFFALIQTENKSKAIIVYSNNNHHFLNYNPIDAKPKNHGSVLNKNIPYSTKINIHSVGPKMDSQDPKDLTIAVLEQIKYTDGILQKLITELVFILVSTFLVQMLRSCLPR